MSAGAWRLAQLNPVVAAYAEWCLQWADYYNVPVTVTSGYRTLAQQAELRQAWENGSNPYPANQPGDSAHNYGLAWDSSVPAQYDAWWTMVREKAGFRVPPDDQVHAEVPNWRNYI